jgi:nicotinate-nucleotide--dimethylbenzimidazole phosphoribosyltransferase
VTDDALALAFRSGLPFVGLRDHEPDPDVDRIVPPEAAAAAGVVALAASADHVRFAVAHPSVNLSSLAPYLGNRRVELAIAPRTELEAIVGAAPKPAVEPPPVGQETLLPAGEDESAALVPAEPLDPEEPPAAAEPVDAAEPPGVEEPAAAAEPVDAAEPATPAEPLDPGEPPAAAEPVDAAEPPAVAEPGGEEEPVAAERPHEAEPPPGEPPHRPTAAELLAAVATPGAEELLGATPAARPDETAAPATEPEPVASEQPAPVDAPPVERYKAQPEPPDPGEDPSWLEPPSRLKRVMRVLLVIMLLIVIAGGALLAYLLTR